MPELYIVSFLLERLNESAVFRVKRAPDFLEPLIRLYIRHDHVYNVLRAVILIPAYAFLISCEKLISFSPFNF